MAQSQPTYEEWKQQRQAEKEQKYRAYEDSYRAFQSGNTAQDKLAVSFNQEDFDGWKQWRKQNADRLDFEYTVKALDQDVLSRVADKYKSQWGDKQYYDLFDPEDAYRLQTGAMPKYLIDKYDLNDPYDHYLYENNLPYRSMFNDMYSEAYKDYAEEQSERANRLNGIVSDWNSAADSYNRFRKDYIAAADKARNTKGSDLTDSEMEDLTTSMLTSGKYDDVVRHFTLPSEADADKDAITLYIESQNQPDYSAYDSMLKALQEGTDVDESFFDSYKDVDYRKWLAQKVAFTQQDLSDAYRYSRAKAQAEKYTDYAEAVNSADVSKAAEALEKIKEDVDGALQEKRWDKANHAYNMLITPEVTTGLLGGVTIPGESLNEREEDLRNVLRREKYSDAEIDEYIELRKRMELIGQDEKQIEAVREQQKIETQRAENAVKLEQMTEEARAAMADPAYILKTAEPNGEFRGDSWLDELIDEDASGLKRLWQDFIRGFAAVDTAKYEAGRDGDYVLDDASNPKYYAQRYMTDDEKAVLNYYRTEKGDDAAREYLEALMPELYRRDAATVEELAGDVAAESGFAASVLPALMQAKTAGEGYNVLAGSLFGGEETSVNDPRLRYARLGTQLRGNVAEGMSPTGQFFYQTGMSMLDNIARLPMGKAGLGLMAGSVMAQGTDQALQSGATPEQAVAIGAASAMIEVVTEKISLENMLEIIKGVKGGSLKNLAGNWKEIIKQALKQGGFEASEEAASEILNILADIQIMGDDSEWEQLVRGYMQHDPTLTRRQAEAKALGSKAVDTLLAGAGGFLSGGIMGGGGTMLYNYSAGLRSGGNVGNALSVGTKAIAQYKQDAANVERVGAGLQAQVMQDVGSLPIDAKTKQGMIDVSGRISQQPVNWMPAAVVGVYRNFTRTLNNLANRARSINAEYTARQEKTTARLTALYEGVQTAYDETKAALDKGDLRAHAAAMQKVQKAIEDYKSAFAAAETEAAVQETRKAEQEAAIANKAKAEAEKLDSALEEAAQYQEKMAASIEERDADGKLAALRDELATQEKSLEELDEEIAKGEAEVGLDQETIAQNAADAMARNDAEEYNLWQAMLSQENAPLQSAENGDTFDVINEMVNGGQNNETVQTKGETNGEEARGQDSVLGNESVRARVGQKDHRSGRTGEEQAAPRDAGKTRRAESRRARRSRNITWGERQDADVRAAIDQFNNDAGTNIGYDSVRPAESIPHTLSKMASILKVVTGRDVFFIESDNRGFGGFASADGKNRYVVATGNLVTDVFNIMHEDTHSMWGVQNAVMNMLKDGTISQAEFDAYKEKRRQRIARNRGVAVDSVNLGSDEHLRTEFSCDMAGAYAVNALLDGDVWEAYGIDRETIRSIKDAIDGALEKRSLTELDAENGEREYRTLAEAGAALSAQAAMSGDSFLFSENALGLTDYSEKERSTLLRDAKNRFANSEQEIVDFINNNVMNRNSDFLRLYCGKVGNALGKRIFNDTGFDLTGTSFVIDSYFENSHSDETKERLRGQQAITPEIIARLPNAVSNYEQVFYEGAAKDGREVFRFVVDIDGEKRVVEYYSKSRKTLTLQTIYGWQKEKNLSATSDAKTPDRTSKTTDGFGSSDNRISSEDQNNNTSAKSSQFNFSEDVPGAALSAEDARFSENAPDDAIDDALRTRNFEAEKKEFQMEINKWDFKDHGGFFVVGTPGRALMSVGVPALTMHLDQSKAVSELRNHSREVNELVIKALPDILNDPVALVESYDNSVMVLGETSRVDSDGSPITATVVLRLRSFQRGGAEIEVLKVRSLHGRSKDEIRRIIADESRIVYLNEDKNRTDSWFQALGRYTPFGGNNYGSIKMLSFANPKNNTSAESSQFNFSEDAPSKRQSRLNRAWELYDGGYNPTEYYAENPDEFDIRTSNLLRGLMLRNGERAGGALSDNEMQRVTDIFSRGKRRRAFGMTLSSPVRVFEDVTGWGGETAEERAQNVRDGNYLKNTYYEYGNVQAANRETWIAEKMRPVIEAITNNGNYGALESSITQMLGEGILTEEQAKNAVSDGKTMIVEVQDGVFVLDGKSHLLYSSDAHTSTEYTEEYRERIRRAVKAGKGNKINAFMPKAKITESPLHVTRNGNTVTVKDTNGKVVAEVTNGVNPNMKAVNAAMDALKTFYADAYTEISNVRLENGYAPPGYIENYFPHQSRTYDGVEGFIEALTANDLPTGINGMTGTFSPGQPWNANLQTRLGTYTEFDAIRGLNRYVNGAGDTIFYTPVIQRLRQLEKAIRTQGASALTEEDATRNSAFVDWLHEYANEYANKKSSFDRGSESVFGREAYSVSQMLTKMVSASAVGGSVSSAMSNIISGLTGYAQIDAKYTVPEIFRTIGQLFQRLDKKGHYDGFADRIPFMKRRFSDNEDILLQNVDKLKRSGSKALYALFSAIDRFTVESVARSKYAECLSRGMTEVQAIAATNDLLIKNFADRGKGQAARAYNVKWLKPVTQFQLEVLNQMYHFRDMDRAEVEAKLADLEREYGDGIPFDELAAKALSGGGFRKLKKELTYLVLLSLWGMLTRELLGRDQTWNPYGMAKDAVKDFQEGGVKQAGEGILESVIDQAPFLSVLSGGGRVPIAGNLSYVTDILEAVLNGEPEKLTNADWIKGGTAFIPGGGQLRKTLTGLDANAQGGSYTDDGKLRYPITEDDFWRSVVFGPSAVAAEGYEWGTTLSKKDTEIYQELVEEGYDQADLYDTLLNYGGASNAEKALSLLANRNDFNNDELDVIAEAVGLNYSGSLERYAEKEANQYLKKKQKELDAGEITQEKYDEIEDRFDEYWRIIVGMDN